MQTGFLSMDLYNDIFAHSINLVQWTLRGYCLSGFVVLSYFCSAGDGAQDFFFHTK